MATSSSGGDVVAFDLGPASTTTTSTLTPTTTNGFLECSSQDPSPLHLDRSSGVLVHGADGGGDSLICDNNNNELTKLDTPEPDLIAKVAPSCTPLMKDHQVSGDQSIDSGVAGGDSDEVDCVQPPPPVSSSVIQPPPLPQPICRSVGSSSSRSSVIGSGDELSPAEKMLQDQFFMNGRLDDENEEQEEEEEEAPKDAAINDEDRKKTLHSSLGGSLEEDCSAQIGKGFVQDCKICQNPLQTPRVLSCLHVFCEGCLDAQLMLSTDIGQLTCPVCQQKTPVGLSGASSLHLDYVLTNILDLSKIDLSVLACTSCKSKDVAISRCNDCANILCASCDNAHQYMRCFEKHTVVRLQELLEKSSDTVAIHKPLFCAVHPTENLRYYCQHCQVPVCNECLIGDHKGGEHCYEVIAEAEVTARLNLERLQRDSKSQVEHCNEAQLELDAALMELQSQHDAARLSIEESYQSFKAVLEKCRDNALKQLDSLHSERELKVMEVMHDVEKCTEKIETATRFTERVLAACNGPELLTLKGLIVGQFGHLVKNVPRTNANYSIEFESKFDAFQQLAQETFGHFQTESSAPSPKESTPPPTLPGMPPILLSQHHQHQGSSQQHAQGRLQNHLHLQVNLNGAQRSLMNGHQSGNVSASSTSSLMGISAFNGTAASQGGALTNSVTASSPISLPPSMQSSFDGDVSGLSAGNANATQPPSSASTTGSIPSFNALMEQHHGVAPGAASVVTATGPVIPPMNVPPPSLVGATGGLTSIAEYNIQQLANLVEQSTSAVVLPPGADMTDAILPTNVSVPPPSTGTGQGAITLNDILSIDPHALQAWSKMGLNNHLSRGPSPSVDNLLLNDFSAIPSSDEIMLTNFNAAAAGVGQNGGGVGQQGQGGGPGGIGVPGRTKSTAMQIRCKFGSLGPSKGQFNSPHGFCLGVDEEIVVADTNNHRIEVFEKSGTFKFQFGVPGKDEGQLWYPRKVAVMRPSSKFVVCDRGNERSRMQIFNKAGHFMKKIAIRYIDIVAGLAVTNQGHIVAVDSVSPTVFIISEEGDLVHWFDCSDYMREPSDIAINGNDFYVCDFKGHCVAVFSDDGTFKYRIGNEKITCFPNGIDISDAGDILIGDSHGNRFHVACFSRDGILQSEYECPYVKVSRCCGLKITSEGFVVTLAKNNHHVLVLNTLYIQ